MWLLDILDNANVSLGMSEMLLAMADVYHEKYHVVERPIVLVKNIVIKDYVKICVLWMKNVNHPINALMDNVWILAYLKNHVDLILNVKHKTILCNVVALLVSRGIKI